MPHFPHEATSNSMRYDEKVVLERADDIKLLWDSEPIQTTYKRRNEFQIVECARYFLSKVHEVMEPDYVPTDDDILQIRIQTIGINEHVFNMKGGGANRKLIMVGIRLLKCNLRVIEYYVDPLFIMLCRHGSQWFYLLKNK